MKDFNLLRVITDLEVRWAQETQERVELGVGAEGLQVGSPDGM